MTAGAGEKRILLIEDNDSLREETANVLELEGFVVDLASNGRIGLERIKAARPDLVLCDLVMPEMDGYETLQAIRADPEIETLPVLILSAREEREQMRHGMELGADDYITKPFKVGDLLRAVDAAFAKVARLERKSEKKLQELRDQVAMALPHELRTPLACIMGYAEMLADGDPAAGHDVTGLAQQIIGAGERLNRMSENALLYVQLEVLGRGRGDVRADAPTAATRIAEVVARQARAKAEAAGRPGELVLALADVTTTVGPAWVAKIVDELVDNAFKFSPRGAAVRVTTGTDGAWSTIRVTDAGRGMTAEQIAAVGGFVQFERSVREQQGLGLGLSIASRVAKVWGGSLAIDSGGGRAGTTITVRLPA